MLAFSFLGLVIGIPSLVLSLWHINLYGHVNALALSMIVFLMVNTLICVFELSLFYCFDIVEKVHTFRQNNGFYKNTPEGREMRAHEPIIVFKDLPLSQLFDPRTWAYVWIDYTRFDPAYVDKTSFGYNIDVGNGHSTFILSVLLMYSIVDPVWSPKVLGIVGVVMYYQKWYGTVMYLFQFINNKKYKYISWKEHVFCVWCSNIIWIIFPMIGFYASVRLIMEDSYAVFQ